MSTAIKPASRAKKAYRLRRAAGHITYTDPAPVREHLARLHGYGVTDMAISRTTGVPGATVQGTRTGEWGRIGVQAARVLLGVTIHSAIAASGPDDPVPALGTHRRLHALFAEAWPRTEIDRLAGYPLTVAAKRRGLRISRRHHDAAVRVHDLLAGAPGPSAKTSARAAHLGYVPSGQWGGADLDDPEAIPAGPETVHASAEAIHLIRGGVHPEDAAWRCGVSFEAVRDYLRRAALRGGPGSADAALYAEVSEQRAAAGREKARASMGRAS